MAAPGLGISREYATIPFKAKGAERDGCDCWGLVRLFYREQLQITLPAYLSEYAEDYTAATVDSAVCSHRREPQWQCVDVAAYGDVALFLSKGLVTHMGVMLNNRVMLHASASLGGVATARVTAQPWRSKLEGFYRYASR